MTAQKIWYKRSSTWIYSFITLALLAFALFVWPIPTLLGKETVKKQGQKEKPPISNVVNPGPKVPPPPKVTDTTKIVVTDTIKVEKVTETTVTTEDNTPPPANQPKVNTPPKYHSGDICVEVSSEWRKIKDKFKASRGWSEYYAALQKDWKSPTPTHAAWQAFHDKAINFPEAYPDYTTFWNDSRPLAEKCEKIDQWVSN